MRLIVLVPLLTLMACGQPDVDDILIDDAHVGFTDATTDAPDGTVSDAEGGVTFNGGGPFLCNDCICDGTLNFCELTDAGAAADAAEAGACPKASGCQPIPIGCLPKPTCTCLESALGGCTCTVDPSGNGLVVVCP